MKGWDSPLGDALGRCSMLGVLGALREPAVGAVTLCVPVNGVSPLPSALLALDTHIICCWIELGFLGLTAQVQRGWTLSYK